MVSRYNGNMYYKHGTDEKLKELRSKKALIDDDKYTREQHFNISSKRRHMQYINQIMRS